MRRRALLVAVGSVSAGIGSAGCVGRARELVGDQPLPNECVEEPQEYYGEDIFEPFEPVNPDDTGPPFYANYTPISHEADVPEGVPDDLEEDLPDDRRIYGASAFRRAQNGDPEDWPDRRARVWAAYEATRVAMDQIEDRLEDWNSVRAYLYASEISPPTSTAFDWYGFTLDSEIAVVFRYRTRCEDRNGEYEVTRPVTSFHELIAAAPEYIDVKITMGRNEVEAKAPVIFHWNYRRTGKPQPG